jgi:glycosyltransferase involved in cell wall biosynthesis
VRALCNLGINVDVVTSDASRNCRVKSEQFKQLETENLKIHPFRYDISERNCFSISALPIILEQARRADIIHVNGIFSFPVSAGGITALYLGKPYLVSLHGGLLPATFCKKKLKKQFASKLFVNKILCSANCIHVTSDIEASICQEMGIMSPVAMIANGIDPAAYQKVKPLDDYQVSWKPQIEGRVLILYLGRISQEKGIDLLIDSWKTVVRRFPDALLVVAGPVFDRFGMRMVNNVGHSYLRDSIIFTGNIGGELKTTLLHKAEILVLPSYSESFGNVVLEAMACHTPIVATEGTPWKSIETIGCGSWVPTRSDAISKAIVRMLSISDQERGKMGEKGHQFAATCFRWDKIAHQFIDTYRSILTARYTH